MAADKRAIALALATAVAIPAEGLRQWAYNDIANPSLPTVCYGHTGADIDKAKVYSLTECTALLNKDMLNAISITEQCVPGLPDKVLAAFADAVFNIGPKIVCDQSRSTAARLLAQGKLREACMQLPRWNRATVAGVSVELPGLTKRREAERDLCLQGLAK